MNKIQGGKKLKKREKRKEGGKKIVAMTDSDPHVRTLRANWDVPSFAACIRVLPTCCTAYSLPPIISSDVQ